MYLCSIAELNRAFFGSGHLRSRVFLIFIDNLRMVESVWLVRARIRFGRPGARGARGIGIRSVLLDGAVGKGEKREM